MKKAHEEGRANNWQDSKKYNNKSYPEKFFEKVIINEFNDTNYVYSYRIGKYALDFAWPYKKLYIEIDGKQHLLNKQYDHKRNLYMKKLGWIGLRIFWTDLYYNTKYNTKYYIKLANDFINNGKIDLNIDINFNLKTHTYITKIQYKIKKIL